MDAPYVLAMAVQAAWTPLSEASLFAHYDLDAVTTIVDTGEGNRLEVASWTDQGPHGKHAVPDIYGVAYRPPYTADAGAPGSGFPVIDFRTGTTGAGLSAPFSDADLLFLRDPDSAWTAQFNLLIASGDTTYRHAIFGTGAQGGRAGIFVDVRPSLGGHYIELLWSGSSNVTMLSAMISPPERGHYWMSFSAARTPKVILYRNGARVADSGTSVPPSLGGTAAGLGLCLGKRPYAADPNDQNHWRGRYVSLFAEAIDDDETITAAAEWAHSKGWV